MTLRAISCVAAVALVAIAASRFMPGPWYVALAKPAWTPPDWVFAPAWTILYLMIAFAGIRAWRPAAPLSLKTLWTAQLALNGMWTPLMFGAHWIGIALLDITALWIAILAFALVAWRAGDRLSAVLFVPYLAWVSYAAALNAAIWWLNR